MPDPTTEGYTVAIEEIEGMVRNLCAYALGEPDPLQRYADLTHQQVLFDGIVAALQRERGRALADLVVSGVPVTEAAAKTNLATVPRVRKLISLAGQTERVKAAAKSRPAPRTDKAADPAPEPPEPPQVAVTGKRMLTAAERVALGLPADGPIPRARPARRRRRAAAV
ncbi:hypothetical protein [Catellatospora tritici]|uniref:hypothetical protein n=1 Tax=Catellatospora tritici TaxID=2851566 RepID=UPI001C2DA669|nr:hypothetical protein [Catellatospora tritici]MBV1850057.1 hypothetical protein [Catellatospora tritici]